MNEYAQLIKRVAKVNHQAALWMARKLPLYVKRRLVEGVTPAEKYFTGRQLAGVMIFSTTPQGFDYWADIATEIGETL